MIKNVCAALLGLFVLNGCTDMKIDDFEGTKPLLVLEEYFAGKTRAAGIFEDRFGNVRRQFTVDITGTWDGRELVLDERFVYSDGETDRRVWRIEKTGPATYRGRAADVVGVAHGEVRGNALNWSYDMDLKVGDGTWRVHFDDWMFLQPSATLINRARVTKFGLEVGTVILAFSRVPATAAQAAYGLSEWRSAVATRPAANQ